MSAALDHSVVQIEACSHYYGARAALANINLTLPPATMIGLVGPDGVGKSTLLALIAGVRRLQQGRIKVFSGNIDEAQHRRRMYGRIAYMPQGLGHNLYASLSVHENVDFFARLFGLSPNQRLVRIEQLLHATGLLPFAERQVGKLSGGMKQKLALCCALVHDPDLLILDEPTTGVDPLSRRQFWELIDAIRAQRPTMTVIAATAYMEEAEHFAWLVAMDAGRVLACEPTEQLKARTQATTMEQAFVALLPTGKHTEHRPTIPPRNMPDHDIVIEARAITKHFGDFVAVDRVDFAIQRGEIFGFLGANGCGKTTTMKMLTGLLPISSGTAQLFGKPIDASDVTIRQRVGFMSQSFSLYSELSVRQNLELHAHLYHLPTDSIPLRIAELAACMDLAEVLEQRAESLPLGQRQRLSLAVAVIHKPELLILDEPTSGVDPLARDRFWELLLDLSRRQNVTIFLSTHFMNEAARCDRVSLMEAGKVLAEGTPTELVERYALDSLEAVFIHCLEQARGLQFTPPLPDERDSSMIPAPNGSQEPSLSGPLSPRERVGVRASGVCKNQRYMVLQAHLPSSALGLETTPINIAPCAVHTSTALFSLGRLLAYLRRETMELLHDPIRLMFALIGPLLILTVMGLGFSLDVENVAFAVLDGDQTPESRRYIDQFAASRYFKQKTPITSQQALEERMRNGDFRVALEIPPSFGKDLRRGRQPEVAAWIDGSLPFRAENIRGYLQRLHRDYLKQLSRQGDAAALPPEPITVEMRFRYNQDFKSVYALVPGVVGVMLMVIPAVLTAVGVVREKELGSIINLYATPVSRLEFLLGKQLPYLAVGIVSAVLMVGMAVYAFGVPLKGSFVAFMLGAVLHVAAATGFGLLISSFTKTQIAALFGTFLLTIIPAINFSGLLAPVAALSGPARLMAHTLPSAYFNKISVGVFTKSLNTADLLPNYLAIIGLLLVFLAASLLLLKNQEE